LVIGLEAGGAEYVPGAPAGGVVPEEALPVSMLE